MNTPEPKKHTFGDAFDDEPTAKRPILPSRLKDLFDETDEAGEAEDEGALSLVPSWHPAPETNR